MLTYEQIAGLNQMGFTNEQIMKLAESSAEPQTAPITTPVPGAQSTETPNIPSLVTKEVQPEPIKEAAPQSVVTDAQIEKLAQLINVGKATIDVPPTVTIDDKLAEHFKALMTGQED